MTDANDIRGHAIETAKHEPQGVTYAGYLALDDILSAQKPRSDQHDEMLFVIIHQTKELWLKQILHEVALAQTLVRAGDLVPAYKSLARVSRIQSVMTQSWDILATMTPADYLKFRGDLGASSGFQSDQFRRLETMLGLKDPRFLRFHAERPAAHAALKAALESPSLYDDALLQLAKAGLPVPDAVLNRDVSQSYEANEGVEAAWLEVYRDTERWWPLYQLAEKLVDLDDALLTWRHKHVVTVERIIGRRQGTGGTDGVGYLVETLKRRCFPELWSLRTKL
ncbi:tryptophan 2,3-dioxygenase [Brevundimonas diminuta]|jgi:tryptophan 2,3-dioxygenase|uniref:tryptophan 2,3-dioxygenase n=1 Tax=Brevundimonas TaxID=41275 RepID=UPI001D069AC3|nr:MULTISPECIES: tryptophan 2,3-dioxygenase [Brevundimonas]MCB7500378.1 tryptophan 2,3-dioxygenase [Enterobacter roggenkampii]MCO8031045.1 tryptophan 2,3-dioxygenase [Brevundimonas diminuta]